MSRRTFRLPLLLRAWLTTALLALVLAAAPPASADWLVTRDGARIETKGSWKVDGNRVVFTLPNGTLSVMRKSEVDLDASSDISAAAKSPPSSASDAGPAEPKKPPVMVLTNKNVAAAAETREPVAREEDTPAVAAPNRPPGSAKVEVVNWESRDSHEVDGLEVVGTLRNMGVEIATNISVAVTAVDQQSQPLYETTAFLRSSGLAPGKSTTFRALLPGIYTLFEDPVFEVQAGAVTVQGAPAPGEGVSSGDGDTGTNDQGLFGDEDENRPPGVIEGVDPSRVFEDAVPQDPQGEGSGS